MLLKSIFISTCKKSKMCLFHCSFMQYESYANQDNSKASPCTLIGYVVMLLKYFNKDYFLRNAVRYVINNLEILCNDRLYVI